MAGINTTVASATYQIHDRLAHMGGLSGTVFTPTSQTVNVTVDVGTSNMIARRGAADFSDVMWWAEWYQDTGAVIVDFNFAVTYDDNSTDTIVVNVLNSTRTGRLIPILSNVAGRYIKSVQSVTLSASTTVTGNFGVTATRQLANGLDLLYSSGPPVVSDWALLGLPRVHDDACLQLVQINSTTQTGILYGELWLVQG